MSDSREQIDAKLAPLMEHFAERLNRVFAYFWCALEFEHDEDLRAEPTHNHRAWTLQTIENACIDSTLMGLRDLDDFFTPRPPGPRTDDLKACDFGYTGRHSFLTQSERRKINKIIAHTTTVGAASRGYRWDVLELASKGISQAWMFLQWVEKEYGIPHVMLYTAALAIRKRTEAQMALITQEAKKRRVTGSTARADHHSSMKDNS
jgi:hypothetical protein